jgi:hypothetical protein
MVVVVRVIVLAVVVRVVVLAVVVRVVVAMPMLMMLVSMVLMLRMPMRMTVSAPTADERHFTGFQMGDSRPSVSRTAARGTHYKSSISLMVMSSPAMH